MDGPGLVYVFPGDVPFWWTVWRALRVSAIDWIYKTVDKQPSPRSLRVSPFRYLYFVTDSDILWSNDMTPDIVLLSVWSPAVRNSIVHWFYTGMGHYCLVSSLIWLSMGWGYVALSTGAPLTSLFRCWLSRSVLISVRKEHWFSGDRYTFIIWHIRSLCPMVSGILLLKPCHSAGIKFGSSLSWVFFWCSVMDALFPWWYVRSSTYSSLNPWTLGAICISSTNRS
jgi:hypothetical protein